MIALKHWPEFQHEATLGSLARFAEPAFEELHRERLFHLLRSWRARRHYRRELGRLLKVGPHMISDIGLTLEDAKRQTAKPFWRQ
jgi:uncharacterized protein YjiS (DUF1127 family)